MTLSSRPHPQGSLILTIVITITITINIRPVEGQQVQGQIDSSDFQFKSIVLGVVVRLDTLKVLNGSMVLQEQFKDLVFSTISALSVTFSSGPSNGSFGSSNGTRTSNITVVSLSLEDDLDSFEEISILFTLLGCLQTYDIHDRVVDQFGPVVHIAITDPGCPRLESSSSLTIPLTWYEQDSDLLQLLIDLRAERVLPKWKDAIVIYDIQSGDSLMDTFAQGFGSFPAFQDIALTLYTINSLSMKRSFSDQIEDILYKYQLSAEGKFVIITKTSNINRVLEVAKRTKMLSIVKQWIFLGADSTGPEFKWDYVRAKVIDDGVNVAFIMNSSVTSNSSLNGQINPLFCQSQALLILLSDVLENLANWEIDLYLQVSNEEWEIIKPTRVDRVVNITENMRNQLNDKVLAFCDRNASSWNLLAGENGQVGKQVFEVGWWNPVTGLRMSDDLLPHVTGGFRQRRIDVTSMHFPPWQIITRADPENPENVTYSGLMFEVLNHMSEDLNFTYRVIEPRPGETWGILQSDGSWTGMMKFIAENKVVLGAAAFTVTPERATYINFTEVLEREAYGFMVNRPEELSRILLFAAPFSPKVWLCIVITVILVAPILNLIHCLSYYYKFHQKVTDRGFFKMKNCYWYIYGSLLQQGGIHLPEAVSGRMLIGFWWLFVIVTVTTYSGNLVAFLTFPKVESPVNTVNDLIHHRGVNTWGFLTGSVIEDHLQRATDPEFASLYRNAIRHPFFNASVLNMVKNHQHAYIDWKIVLLTAMRDTLKATGKCSFIIGAETFYEEKIALAVPRGSPYLPIFNKEISQMQQTGLIKKWKSRYWPGKDKCTSLSFGAAANRKVGIGDMQGSFYLLLLGFCIALVVLIIELIIYRRRRQRMINTLNILVGNNPSTQFWQQKKIVFLN